MAYIYLIPEFNKMWTWLSIDNLKNNIRETLLLLCFIVIYMLAKAYVDKGNEVLKCQLERVKDYKDLRDQTLLRMEKIDSQVVNNKTAITVLKKKVKK